MDEVTFLQAGGHEPADDVLPEGSDRRRPVLALAALAVVALAVGGVLAVSSGSDPAESVAGGSVTAPVAPAATPTASAPASPREPRVVTGETRNPFAALVLTSTSSSAPAGQGAAPAPAPGDAAAAPPAGQPEAAAGGTSDGSTPDAGTGSGSGAESGSVPDQVHTLALVRTTGEGDGRVAVFDLDGSEQSAAVGAAFGPESSLLLLSVQQGPTEGQWTAVVQRGSGDPFDVVTGTPVALH